MRLLRWLPPLLLLAVGCAGWAQRAGDPARIVRTEDHEWIVVGTVNGRETVLRFPRIDEGRIVGAEVEHPGDSGRPPNLVGIPLEEIVWVGTRVEDPVRESKAVASMIGFAATVGFALVQPLFE